MITDTAFYRYRRYHAPSLVCRLLGALAKKDRMINTPRLAIAAGMPGGPQPQQDAAPGQLRVRPLWTRPLLAGRSFFDFVS